MASTSAASPSTATASASPAASTSRLTTPATEVSASPAPSDVKGKAAAEQERTPFDDSDIDRILAQEATSVQRDEECNRVLKAFKLNPYDVLGVEPSVTDEEIHKIYRKKSLMIHPDRYHAARGPEAFDLLKKAQTELLNADKRKLIDNTLADARMLILRSLNLPPETPDTHDKVRFLLPPMRERVKQKAKEILIDDELRRRRTNKMQMIAEGAEAQRIETAQMERKRKQEEKAQWEDSRESRVTDWRSFQKGTNKKKRPKLFFQQFPSFPIFGPMKCCFRERKEPMLGSCTILRCSRKADQQFCFKSPLYLKLECNKGAVFASNDERQTNEICKGQ